MKKIWNNIKFSLIFGLTIFISYSIGYFLYINSISWLFIILFFIIQIILLFYLSKYVNILKRYNNDTEIDNTAKYLSNYSEIKFLPSTIKPILQQLIDHIVNGQQ